MRKVRQDHLKKIYSNFFIPLILSLILFLSHFFFYEYPDTRAQVYVNNQEIKNNNIKCSDLKEDIKNDILEIKESQKEIISILMKR